MDHGLEALVGFVGAHGDTLELLEFAEKILDQMTPFVAFEVDRDGVEPVSALRDDDACTVLVQFGDDPVRR